jgi:hypothetical protein
MAPPLCHRAWRKLWGDIADFAAEIELAEPTEDHVAQMRALTETVAEAG